MDKSKGKKLSYLHIETILHEYKGNKCIEYQCDGSADLASYMKMIASFIRFLKKKKGLPEGDIIGMILIELAKMEAKARSGDLFSSTSTMAQIDPKTWEIIRKMMDKEKGSGEDGTKGKE